MTTIEVCIIIFLLIALIGALIGIYNKNTNAICQSKRRLDGKTAVITGGTKGMGLEIATDLAKRGAKVIIACPFEKEGESAEKIIKEKTSNNKVFFKLLDLASLTSVRKFANDILKNEERLDLLINNAGIGNASKFDKSTEDGLNLVVQVNYFGHFLLTLLLLPLLKETGKPNDKSRIVNVSSVLHNIACIDPTDINKVRYFPFRYFLQGYPNSKAYFVVFTRELSERLKGANVVVNSVDPGAVGSMIFTSIGFWGIIFSYMFMYTSKNVWEGAQTSIFVAVDEKVNDISGKHFKECKMIQPNRLVLDDVLAKKVWEQSIRIVKISEEELKRAEILCS